MRRSERYTTEKMARMMRRVTPKEKAAKDLSFTTTGTDTGVCAWVWAWVWAWGWAGTGVWAGAVAGCIGVCVGASVWAVLWAWAYDIVSLLTGMDTLPQLVECSGSSH